MPPEDFDKIIELSRKLGGIALRKQKLTLHQNGAKFKVKRAYLEDELLRLDIPYTLIIIPEMPSQVSQDDFFGSVQFEEYEIDLNGTLIPATSPLLYNDRVIMWSNFLIPLDRVIDLLPSRKMHPVEIEPGFSAISIIATENRKFEPMGTSPSPMEIHVQTQPFNDLNVAVLVRFKKTEGYFSYTWPTTDNQAVLGGKLVHGLPRVLADVSFAEEGDIRTCQLRLEDQDVITFRVHKSPTVAQAQEVIYFGVKDNHVLKTVSASQGQFGSSSVRGDATLTWGDHPLAVTLRDLGVDDTSVSSVYSKVRSKVFRGVDIGVL